MTDDTQAQVLALIRDDRGAYKLTTQQLERVMAATIGATHGRKSDDPLVWAVERMRRAITAVLQARRTLDALDAAEAKRAEQGPAPADLPTSGGAKVLAPLSPRPPAPPTRNPQPVPDLL